MSARKHPRLSKGLLKLRKGRFDEVVGLAIREARLSKAMTQGELADACGVGPTVTSQIENGRGVSVQLAALIGRVLGVSMDVIITPAAQDVLLGKNAVDEAAE